MRVEGKGKRVGIVWDYEREEDSPSEAELHELHALFLESMMQVRVNPAYQVFEAQHHALQSRLRRRVLWTRKVEVKKRGQYKGEGW